jgi:uncharacterized protein (DUF1499 family)
MTLSLVALGLSAAALLLLALSGPAYRIGLSLQNAFAMLSWGAYVGLAGLACAIAAGALGYKRRHRQPTAVALVAAIAAITAVGVPYAWQRRARSAPPIHDISTDLENPPAFEAIVPLRADAPNALDRPPMLAAQQREGYPDVSPLTLPLRRDEAFNRALAVAQDMDWEIVSADRSAGRIEATATTTFFGFKDDVVIRLTPWGTGTRVDVRSVSRVGRSDVGTNARRIEAFLDALEE